MIPHQALSGRDEDAAVNFRFVKESTDVDFSASRLKGVPLNSNLPTPAGEIVVDPFEEFNSITLHHDGEDHHHVHDGLTMNGHHKR